MELSRFLKYALKHGYVGGVELRRRTERGWDWVTYGNYAELTELIDYKCDFKDGACKSHQNSQCCCSRCGQTVGYHHVLPCDLDLLYMYAKNFTKETGFWRENKGCILPRRLRSAICLGAHCTTKLSKTENLLITLLNASSSETTRNGKPIYCRLDNGKYMVIPDHKKLKRALLRLKHNKNKGPDWVGHKCVPHPRLYKYHSGKECHVCKVCGHSMESEFVNRRDHGRS